MRRRDFLKISNFIIGAWIGGLSYAKNSNFIDITVHNLYISDLKQELKIVAISDLHAPSIYYNNYIELIKIINEQEPDIFILAGDTVDKKGKEGLVVLFKEINAKIAKLAILGNWEYNAGLNLKKLRIEYEKAGVNLLVNELIKIRELSILGLDDFLKGRPNYSIMNRNENPLLVLTHCPQSFDSMPLELGNPLVVIAGHTHGGQIVPFGMVLHKPDGCGSYLKGWYHKNNHCMYVMRGIGTSGIHLRIGAPPEILLLNLLKA